MSRNEYFVLNGREAVPVGLHEWAEMFERGNRRVAFTETCGAQVSTVFLGSNHAFDDGPPLIFESMIFGGPYDQEQRRYSTWDEAEKGHAEMVQMVRAASPFAPEFEDGREPPKP